ncbi:MAG: peptide chain release factor 1 [Bacteroidota bacterium]|nr:peptide chain release factor 1 [Bacteroidota bacterium]
MIDLEKLLQVKQRLDEVTQQLSEPSVAADPEQMARLGPEHRELAEAVEAITAYESAAREADELRRLIRDETDPELITMARDELAHIVEELPQLEEAVRRKLVPKDPEDARGAIVEIRAGTGGSEAALFAKDLYRLYLRFADRRGWKLNVVNTSAGAAGGFKEIVFEVSGRDVFGQLKYESGVHRVQRVPETESSGRLHTSAASVAVLPEVSEVEVHLEPNDLKIDVYRSSGPGGQSVNTTDSAVRITHLPSGLVVTCQDEKSQRQNKVKALRVMRARLYEQMIRDARAERDQVRRESVGSGDRSAKIRTYNYPQDRVTDHRLDSALRNYSLRKVIEGDLDSLVTALRTADHSERMAYATQ